MGVIVNTVKEISNSTNEGIQFSALPNDKSSMTKKIDKETK